MACDRLGGSAKEVFHRELSMKKIFLTTIALLVAFWLHAFHIVGGEIEFITLEPGSYRINLIQYRDEAQDQNPSPDAEVTVYIFSNKTDELISVHTLPFASVTEVAYTFQKCAIDELETSRVLYSSEINLQPQEYADEEGYYVVWERCCRNTTVDNIVNPVQAGMKYVVEIPPLWKNNRPFINSSPTLLKPLSDYACFNQLYYTDFVGTDLDGDSLVYKLATPLNSSSDQPLPIPQPKPHPLITWEDGYSENNMVPGSPPLRISNSGLLTVNPLEGGLYVFSVVVEEWRNKEKIGEVQRDFQMLVREEGCDPPDPPKVGVKIPGDEDFNPMVDTLNYSVEEDKCFDFIVTNIVQGENITLRHVPVNFDEELDDLFSINSSFVGDGQDTLIVEVCAPGCPPIRDGPFIIDLIASDDACPLPQLDTARLTINVEPPPNRLPVLDPLPAGYTINENEVLEVEFRAFDQDMDSMEMKVFIPGVTNPTDRGISLEITESGSGIVEGKLIWDTDCQRYDFSDIQNFQVGLVPEDFDICEVENTDFTFLNLGVILPPNTDPQLSLSTANELFVNEGDRIALDAQVSDQDGDTVRLRLEPLGFDMEALGVSFTDTTGVGEIDSPFEWTVDCNLFANESRRVYEFWFITEDQDRCDATNADTLLLTVNVNIPENNRPQFNTYADTVLEMNVPFELDIIALDEDMGDSVTIEFFNPARLPRSESLNFQSATGLGRARSTLRWTPECSLLDFGTSSTFYDLEFLAYDNGCPIQRLDTIKITFELRETREKFTRFEPPNVFTPNGDGTNDVYTLTNLSKPGSNLPPDHCDDAFEYISIHDRSGNQVFSSTNREFTWDGGNVSSGVYYYVIKYQRTDYKGYLQVLR